MTKRRTDYGIRFERANHDQATDPAWVLGEVIEGRVYRDSTYQYVTYGVPVPLTEVVEDVLAEQGLVELHPKGAVTITDKGEAWRKALVDAERTKTARVAA